MNYPWHHGRITRQAAEHLLIKNSADGAFLVRESESVCDAHVLSLWHGNMIHHFRVFKKDNKFTVQTSDAAYQRLFSNLGEIIELFKQPKQGLPCALKNAIIKEATSDQLEHDSDDDEQDDQMANLNGDLTDGYETADNGAVSSFFLTKLCEKDTSGFDEEFYKELQIYLNSGFARDGTRLNTLAPATDLQELIVKSATCVRRELKEFLKKIAFLQELFSPQTDAGELAYLTSASNSSSTACQSNNVVAYDELVDDFANSLAGVKLLQTLPETGAMAQPFTNGMVDTIEMSGDRLVDIVVPYGTKMFSKPVRMKAPAQKTYRDQTIFMETPQSQTRTFEVNTCGNFRTKACLKVDITKGKLWFMKNESDSIEDCSVVDHDKILQLVKDPDTPKLTFKIDNKSNREYVFKDVQARENLCQLAQYMMNLHAPNRKELKEILIFVGTWNMGYATPQNMESWLNCDGSGKKIENQELIGVVGHDIYAIGTQETSVGENSWISRLKMALKLKFKIDYYTVAVHSLWGIRLVILAKPEHENRISRVEKSSVKTGIANKLGNKGGVGISFDFLSTSFCFISTHLASGHEELRKTRRAQNYLDILKGLNLGHKSAYDLTNQFHHVFWFGDLNYRIDLEFDIIVPAILRKDYKTLESEDQLKKEQKCGRVFFEFYESELYFPPTYRYKRGTRDAYDHIKVKRSGNRTNVPSWCDRVLWKSFPELPIKEISYGCTDDIVTSDHSPVFASFEVPITSQFVASQDQAAIESQTNKPSCKLFFQGVKAKIQTRSKTKFYLEFHSVCVGANQKSKVGKDSASWDPPRVVDSKPSVYTYSEWDATLMPELNPILDNQEYLSGQHLLIAVKSDADESYGECVLSLKPHLFSLPQPFETNLTHGGVKTGEITGYMNVQRPKPKKPVLPVKLDAGNKKQAPNSPSRPYSYIGPATPETMPLPKKAFSLGRHQAPAFYTVTFEPSVLSEKTHAPLPVARKRTNENVPGNQTTDSGSSNPPRIPEMAVKGNPTTVIELLWKIGLIDYLSNLEDNGFEDILFLEDVDDDDLEDAGITNGQHRKQILNEVQRLKRSGYFNS